MAEGPALPLAMWAALGLAAYAAFWALLVQAVETDDSQESCLQRSLAIYIAFTQSCDRASMRAQQVQPVSQHQLLKLICRYSGEGI